MAFTVDAIGNPEPITVEKDCREVKIREQGGAGNTVFTIYDVGDPTGVGESVVYPAGAERVFKRGQGYADFRDGEVIGYIAVASGTATFSMECD